MRGARISALLDFRACVVTGPQGCVVSGGFFCFKLVDCVANIGMEAPGSGFKTCEGCSIGKGVGGARGSQGGVFLRLRI